VVPPEQVPPVSVVPGLVKGLAATARAAALHHSAHGGHGGGATKATVSAYSHRGASQAATHAAARALSSLPVLHFLDHQASAGLAPGAGVRSASQLAAASDSFKEGRHSIAVSNHGVSPPGSFDSGNGNGSFDRPQSPQLYATAVGRLPHFSSIPCEDDSAETSAKKIFFSQEPGFVNLALYLMSHALHSVMALSFFLQQPINRTNTQAELKEEDDWVRRVRLEAERANLKDRAAGELNGLHRIE